MLLTWAPPGEEPGRAPVTNWQIFLDEQTRPIGVTGSLSYLLEEKGFKRGIERGIELGIELGIETGRAEERALLCRQAERKFDAETATRLAEIPNRVAVPGGLAEIGESIIECDTGAGLLDRASGVARRLS